MSRFISKVISRVFTKDKKQEVLVSALHNLGIPVFLPAWRIAHNCCETLLCRNQQISRSRIRDVELLVRGNHVGTSSRLPGAECDGKWEELPCIGVSGFVTSAKPGPRRFLS